MSASRFSGTADELLVAILQAHLLAHLGVDGLGHLHGRLQDCKLTLHIKFERALDISLIIDVRLAFDVPSHDAQSNIAGVLLALLLRTPCPSPVSGSGHSLADNNSSSLCFHMHGVVLSVTR